MKKKKVSSVCLRLYIRESIQEKNICRGQPLKNFFGPFFNTLYCMWILN